MDRIFVVDDHELIRRGMRHLIRADDGIEIIGESATARDAATRIPALRPDVAVLDVRLPDGTGIDVCRGVRAVDQSIKVLILTGYDETLFAAISAGAAGYLLKSTSGGRLLAAIHAVARGETVIDPALLPRVLHRVRDEMEDHRLSSGLSSLTPPERRILTLLTQGFTNRQIGNQVALSESTVKGYVSSVLTKLGLEHRTQAAVLASRSPRSSRSETVAACSPGLER
ncbi:MAG TPA: response regulator transcription factor [Nocardioidaceae bacterium]